MLEVSRVYKSNSCGDFVVLANVGGCSCEVEFLITKYRTTATYSNIRRGSVYDYMYPSVCGIGFIGVGKYKAYNGDSRCRAFSVWSNMIRRCYDENNRSKYPTYRGCTVCDEWHNFQAFAQWFYDNHSNNKHLDKDIRVSGNKVYSPFNCLFVTQNENNIDSHAKRYQLTSPEGKSVNVYNLNKFCRDNGLDTSNMLKVLSGKYKHQKGWTAQGWAGLNK